jgi:hypothetical protein
MVSASHIQGLPYDFQPRGEETLESHERPRPSYQGGIKTPKQIPWEIVIEPALDQGSREQKAVFVDFWLDG